MALSLRSSLLKPLSKFWINFPPSWSSSKSVNVFLTFSRARIKARAAAAEAATNKKEEKENQEDKEPDLGGNYGVVKEDFLKQPFKSPEGALKEAMNLLAQDDW